MTTAFTSNMFESIKSALTKQNEAQSSKFKDYLRTAAGNTYTVRLLPFKKNPDKTFFHYYSYTWNSHANGQLTTVVSPATWNQRDPIAEESYRVRRNGTEEEKAKASALIRRENWLANVYVVNDPVNPENNGTVKILRYGKQLHKIIVDAITGEESVDFGPRIFDLSPKGCNFRIKVEKQGDYPTYVSSKFALPKEIEGLDEDDYDKVLDSAFDLESYVTCKSYDEIKEILDTHYHCKKDVEETETADPVLAAVKSAVPAPAPRQEKAAEPAPKSTVDESIEDLLAGLDE